MVIGIGIITFRLHECRSLKSKRKIVKSIVNQVRNQFNVSIAEVGSNEIYQRAEIGFSLIGNDAALINSKIDIKRRIRLCRSPTKLPILSNS